VPVSTTLKRRAAHLGVFATVATPAAERGDRTRSCEENVGKFAKSRIALFLNPFDVGMLLSGRKAIAHRVWKGWLCGRGGGRHQNGGRVAPLWRRGTPVGQSGVQGSGSSRMSESAPGRDPPGGGGANTREGMPKI